MAPIQEEDTMTDRIALITGASRGLGKASALHLAKRGTPIIGTYKTSADAAKALSHEIEAMGVKAAMLPFDAEDDDYVGFAARLNRTLETTFGGGTIGHLVNNAGIGIHAAFQQTTPGQLDQLYRIHVRAPYFLTQALLPTLSDGARILFVSSAVARFTLPGYSAYAPMKGAIEVLTRYLAKELSPRRIRVNCIAPGAVETDFSGGAVRDNPEINRMVASMTALGRPGQADDIGGAVAAILSDDMHWLNGERIELSGGQSL